MAKPSAAGRRTSFGAWLWSELDARKLTFRDFQKLSGISVASLSRWMRMYTSEERPELPSRKMVKLIASTLSYKGGPIQLLVDQSWAEYNKTVSSSDMPSLSAEARLFAERFDRLPKVVRDALWRAAFGEESFGGDEQ